MIPKHQIEKIIQQSDIVEVISSYISLKKRGNNYIACCPFHQEKTPSFTVSDAKQMYYCFGCKASGNVINFIMQHTGLDFIATIENLATLCGLNIEYIKSANPQMITTNKINWNEVMIKITQLYQNNLHLVQDYIKSRNISSASLNKFQIGYATNMPLTDSNGIATAKSFVTLGLMAGESHLYNRFNNRLMFPIHNIKGAIIAFGARRVDNHSQPKYLNSANNFMFDKSKELYGLYLSLKEIKSSNAAIIVEGYMDVVMMHQYGFTTTVASMGTSINEVQIKKIFKYGDNIYFMFDGDEAGKKAAWQALEVSLPLIQDHKQIHFAFLPDSSDPDSVLNTKGREFVSQLLERSSLSVGQFLINYLSLQVGDLSTDSGKTRLMALLKPYYNQLHNIHASTTKVLLIEQMSALINLDYHLIEQILSNNKRSFYRRFIKNSGHDKHNKNRLSSAQVALPKRNVMLIKVLTFLMLNPKLTRLVNLPFELTNQDRLTILQKALLCLLDYLSIDCDDFKDISLSKLESIFIETGFDIIGLYHKLQTNLFYDKDNTLNNVYKFSVIDIENHLKALLSLKDINYRTILQQQEV